MIMEGDLKCELY